MSHRTNLLILLGLQFASADLFAAESRLVDADRLDNRGAAEWRFSLRGSGPAVVPAQMVSGRASSSRMTA